MCLFIWLLFSFSRFFSYHMHVSPLRWHSALFRFSCMTIEQLAIGSILESTTPTLKQDVRLINYLPFSSGTITTTFNDLGVSVLRNFCFIFNFDINWSDRNCKKNWRVTYLNSLRYELYIIQGKHIKNTGYRNYALNSSI